MSAVLNSLPDPAIGWNAPTKFQIRQTYVEQVLQSVYRGNCTRVLGPRFRYKSKVLYAAVDALRSHPYFHVIYVPMADVATSSVALFFQSILERVVDSFSEEELPPLLSRVDEVRNALDFQHALWHLASHSRKNLVLLADSLEMIPLNMGALLVGVLRTVFLMRADEPGARFQAIVAGSISLSQIALENASGFESVADLVLIGDLDEAEQEQLVRGICLENGIEPEHAAVAYLLSRTGGDPFLIEEVLKLACRPTQDRMEKQLTTADVEAAEAQFLNQEPHPILVSELRHIETDPDLLTACLLMLEHGTVPANELPGDIERSPSAAELCGAFEAVGDGFRIKPGIWRDVLGKHFKPSRIGEKYFVIGNWKRAMEYLGRAVATGGYEVRVELYATVLNAINASTSLKQAFEYLQDGLEALYAANDPCVYTVQGHELHPVTRQVPAISRHAIEQPEIDALEGPKYSINGVNGQSKLLVPLRVGNRGARLLGLVTLSTLSGPSRYEQRDETSQLVSFLQQASQAIFTRMELERTERVSEQLRALNSVLTTMLHRRFTTVRAMLRVAMEGVTHGWGLGYNRAVLFEPDASGNELVATMGIGHLTQEEAEAEWKKHPYDGQTLDEWLQTLFEDPQEKAEHQELEKLIKQFTVPIKRDNADQLLARSFMLQRPILASHSASLRGLPLKMVEEFKPSIPFAIVPLHTSDKVLGVLYVDDKFAPSFQSAERFQLLHSFTTQTSLIIENAKAMAKAELQTRNVEGLRKQHLIMTTGLVHELRTSMTGVVDLLKETATLATEGQSVAAPLNDLTAKARIISDLTNKIPTFDKPAFDPKPYRLSSVIYQALDAVERDRPAYVELSDALMENDPPIFIDKGWIELLLRNLLLNAFEAFSAARPGSVHVELNGSGDMVCMRVSDNGPGIPADIIAEVFEPGVTTKETRFRGMGLFYCRQVAQEHHGSLEVESKPGEGAVFTLQLPLQKHGALNI